VRAGGHTLWAHGEARERDIAITNGNVTERHWELHRATPGA